MNKKFHRICLSLALSMTSLSFAISPISILADSTKQNLSIKELESIIKALNLLDVDKALPDSYTKNITRAQFAQILINVSTSKGKVSKASKVTLYTDVPRTHWAASYIQSVVKSGFMTGYIDGSFHPDSDITLKEAAKGVLGLLGYSKSDFTGNAAAAQMNLYHAKGLDQNIALPDTGLLSKGNCIRLLYNTLTAKTKTELVYAQTLGYPLDASGDLDYLQVLETDLKGPFLADASWMNTLPFDFYTATYYRNTSLSSANQIKPYDVLYYSKAAKTVYAFDNKKTGTVGTVSPNTISPTSVLIAGVTYPLGTAEMRKAFSSLGTFSEGDRITVFLGKDNSIVAALGLNDYNTTVNGVVIETGEKITESKNPITPLTGYITVITADGSKQTYECINGSFSLHDAVKITYNSGAPLVTRIDQTNKEISGSRFQASENVLGSFRISSSARILDVTESAFRTVHKSRLDGYILTYPDILYYQINDSAELTELILNDVTGDAYDYGIMVGYDSVKMGQGPAAFTTDTYRYIINGIEKTATSSEIDGTYGEDNSPCGFLHNQSGTLTKLRPLSGGEITVLNTASAKIDGTEVALADSVEVYYYKDMAYHKTTLEKVADSTYYSLKGYYDNLPRQAGRIRVIIAESK